MRDTNLVLHASASRTATGNGSTVDFFAADVRSITYQLLVTAVSGTSPTLDIKIQESDDGSTWRDFAAMKQVTAIGEQRVTARSNARYRRVVYTIGGTTPDFTFEVYPELGGRYTNF